MPQNIHYYDTLQLFFICCLNFEFSRHERAVVSNGEQHGIDRHLDLCDRVPILL